MAPSWLFRVEEEWLTSGSITLTRKEVIPIEWRPIVLTRKEVIPIEWRQLFLSRREKIPIEWRASTGLFTRKEKSPIEWVGVATGSLLVTWNVLARLNTPIVVRWNVLNSPPLASLTVRWIVKEQPATLTVQWNVLSNVQAQFNQDIQRPSASIA
jgi:hypothetical protein